MKMIEIDGSQGEGGGQMVRTALALSALTGKEFRIYNIRSSREKGGLKAQHLGAVNALKQICDAETNQVELGSSELVFKPGKIKKGTFEIDIGTAGSITLLLQAVLLPCLFAPGKVTLRIKGGTCGKGQASVDYLQNVLVPHLKKFAGKLEVKILKRGYYPKGGGELLIEISPKWKLKDFEEFSVFWEKIKQEIPKIDLTEQGKLEQVKGVVNCSRELEKGGVAERIKTSAEYELKKLNCPLNIRLEYAETPCPGGEVVLWAVFSKAGEIEFDNPVLLGADALAEKDKSSEEVGKEAAQKLIKEIESRGGVDKHLGDQLLLFMALLPGSQTKVSEITEHAKTNMQIVELFLPLKFEVEGNIVSVSER